MKDNIVSVEGLQNLMDAAVGHASIGFNGAKVYPFTNDVDPAKTATVASFTAATFTGSAPKVITWGTPYQNANNDPEVMSGLESFVTTGDVDETIFGFVVVDGVDVTKLRFYGRLDAGKRMKNAGDTCAMVARLTLSQAGFGSSVQVSE